MRRKNPYLFKAKNITTAEEFVKHILRAYLSSQEETIFGSFLENLAIFICTKVYGGRKSTAEGIDLEFCKEGTTYIVSIKSGPNWGNSSQISKMKDNFRKAKRILKTNAPDSPNVIAINGCSYGKDRKPDKGEYLKLCGQEFWSFISGVNDLYVKIIEPLGHRAKQRNEEFLEEYSKVVNLFTGEFLKLFCSANGSIRWEEIVKFNSENTSKTKK